MDTLVGELLTLSRLETSNIPLEKENMNALFIFCTTELDKIRPAVLSRTQNISLKPVKQKDLAKNLIEIAKKEGGEVIVGGERYTENGCDKGAFVKPTLIAGVNNGCRISQEEVFGPVSVIIKFKTDEWFRLKDYYGIFLWSINKMLKLLQSLKAILMMKLMI